MIVVVCVTDTAKAKEDGKNPILGLLYLGATEAINVKYRMPYCLVTRKGDAPSWKKEVVKREYTKPSICEVAIY